MKVKTFSYISYPLNRMFPKFGTLLLLHLSKKKPFLTPIATGTMEKFTFPFSAKRTGSSYQKMELFPRVLCKITSYRLLMCFCFGRRFVG